ncbi:MAG: gamma-glutamyltransferase family protein [Candidatus Limnocylindrales bacterium]
MQSSAAAGPALVPAITVRGVHGAVVSPHALATEAGLGMLRAGGSAVDAAVATNAALAVVNGYMCGLGGDAFWLIWTPERGPEALNGSGRSAGRATIEAARQSGFQVMPERGPWTVTVPGAIRSWADAHRRHGRLPWSDLLAPAVELAEGFAASPAWSSRIESAAGVFGARSEWARTYRPEGRPWRAGERVRLPALTATLRRLAEAGPDDAYEGELARRAATYLSAAGSPLQLDDLSAHVSTWGDPLRVPYRGVHATSHPPNSTGAVALELLAILARFNPPSRDAFGPRGIVDPDWVHILLEAARLTLADRDAHLTDPGWMVPADLALLLDPGHAAEMARRIDRRRATPPPPLRAPRGGGTIFLATADAQGGVVSMLQSNYAGFGSGLVDPVTGIAYQNRGAFFSLDPRHPNALAPGKRTMHTLTPGLLFRDGRPWVAHGSMGGEIQPQVFAQFVTALVDGRRGIADAVAAPRFAADAERHFGPTAITHLEGGLAPELGEALAARGHAIHWTEPFSSAFGHQHAIELIWEPGARTPTSFAATADPRSEGLPGAW